LDYPNATSASVKRLAASERGVPEAPCLPPVSRCGLAAIVAAAAIALPASVAGAASAPGAPGQRTTRASSGKDGFGTSLGRTSRVWFTLSHGKLTEVYYPRLDVRSVRGPELVVDDGRTFTERESAATTSVVTCVDGAGLTSARSIRRGRGATGSRRHT
jgi:hypothetical protein